MPIASFPRRLESHVTWSCLSILGSPLDHLEMFGTVVRCSSSFPSHSVRIDRVHSMHHLAHSVGPEKFTMLAWAFFMARPSPNYAGQQCRTAMSGQGLLHGLSPSWAS